MGNDGVTILNNEFEYKPILRHSILSLFQAIQLEVFSVIDLLGYTRDEYVINIYPLTIERKDGKPVSDMLLECIRSRFGERLDIAS
jgi:hypothetical protein